MAQRSTRQPTIHSGRLLLGIGGLLIFLLTLVSCLAAASILVRNNRSSTHTADDARPARNTPGPPMATSGTVSTNPDWHTYSFPTYGFRVDIPIVLSPQHALLINGGAGESIDWVYNGAAPGSPLLAAAAETIVRVQYATAISDTDICPSGRGTHDHRLRNPRLSRVRCAPRREWPGSLVSVCASQPGDRRCGYPDRVGRPGHPEGVLRSVWNDLAAPARLLRLVPSAPASHHTSLRLRAGPRERTPIG